MLHDANYNLVKLLHDLSKVLWHVKNHTKKDAKKHKHHKKYYPVYETIEKDLEKHIGLLLTIVTYLVNQKKLE